MKERFVLFGLLTGLVVFAGFAVSAEISIGVKAGDWIEYHVSFTGTPPEGHAVTWARMYVSSVQGKHISLLVSTKQSDGSLLNETVQLDLETGQLGDGFIIPANLNCGDVIFDRTHGNITVSNVTERDCAGAKRTVVSGTVSEKGQQGAYETTYYWDRATGVLVEGYSSYVNFVMFTKVERTNMWQPQLFGLDQNVFYAMVIGILVFMVVIAALVLRRKK
ncbi:MAG: hypothetical protein QXU99_02935 [Candidatus Bathyarchaeia archaeon]